jgi:Fe-S cluster biogenesis protein NfuA
MDKLKILAKAEEILESIRPYLRKDEGDIKLLDYEEEHRTLVVSFEGNCKDCSLSMMTLRAGIEKLILKQIPQVRRVEKD